MARVAQDICRWQLSTCPHGSGVIFVLYLQAVATLAPRQAYGTHSASEVLCKRYYSKSITHRKAVTLTLMYGCYQRKRQMHRPAAQQLVQGCGKSAE